MMNKVILVGRLTKNPESRQTASSTVTSFTLAVSRPFTNQQDQREADFIPVVVWRKQAENAAKYLKKGSLCGVEGRIQTRTYDNQNGEKRYVTEVVADNVVFLETKGSQEENNQEGRVNKVYDEDDSKYNDIKFTPNDLPF